MEEDGEEDTEVDSGVDIADMRLTLEAVVGMWSALILYYNISDNFSSGRGRGF